TSRQASNPNWKVTKPHRSKVPTKSSKPNKQQHFTGRPSRFTAWRLLFCPVESLQPAAHVCDNVVISIPDSSADAILVFAPDGTESTFATDHSNPRGIAFVNIPRNKTLNQLENRVTWLIVLGRFGRV